MAINKVIYGNDTLIDLTSDTVDSSNLLSGYTAHDRSGASIVGSAVIPTVNDGTLTIQKNGTNVATFSANQSSNTTANILVDELTESTDNEPYTLRQGKGDMVDMELVGGSFAWNQLVQNGNFASTSGWDLYGGSLSVSSNVGSLTYDNSSPSLTIRKKFALLNAHKILVCFSIKNSSSSQLLASLDYDNLSRNQILSGTIGTSFVDVAKIISFNSTDVVNSGIRIACSSPINDLVISIKNIVVIDLTQLFGTTIADAIYAMEQATAGSGVAWFRQYFPNAYYAYDAGSIQSVNVTSRKVVGKNLADVSIGIGKNWDGNTNVKRCWCTWRVPVGNYVVSIDNTTAFSEANVGNSKYPVPLTAEQFNSSGWRNTINLKNSSDRVITVSNEFPYIFISFIATADTISEQDFKDVHFQIESGTTATAYEPYESHIANFDATKQLRGIPSLVNNKLVYDGDIYTPNGITRKYGIVDLGSLTWVYDSSVPRFYSTTVLGKAVAEKVTYVSDKYTSYPCSYGSAYGGVDKIFFLHSSGTPIIHDSSYTDADVLKSALSGHYLVIELATPTTESAEPYQNPQRADASGTEEFIDFGVSAGTRDVSIPCGHNSTYKSSEVIQPLEDYVDSSVKSGLQYYESMIPIKLYATGSFTSSTSTTTTVTVTNANINYNANNPIEVTSDVFGLTVSNISVSGSGTGATISITFPKMSSAQTVNYRVYIITI